MSMGSFSKSSKYPALTPFFKAEMYNYLPWVYCPHCGMDQDKHPDEHHVYLCMECDVEFYKGYDGYVKFISKIDDDGYDKVYID